jgi:hypothetical protein
MVNDDDRQDEWIEAAQAFVFRVGNRPLTVHRVAIELAWLSEVGYIVAPKLHESLCDEYVAKLLQAERAADELVEMLHHDGPSRKDGELL